MAGTALPGRLIWRVARLAAVRQETATARTLVLDVPEWPGHLAGQHVDVRLTAEDGYSTQRSYSIAAPADGTLVELTIQRVADGEVSPYLTDDLRAGDLLELRGPVGGWFVWRPTSRDPVLLVAGGAGIVPLRAMLLARRHATAPPPFRLVYSVRSPDEVFYAKELATPDDGVTVDFVYTRRAPGGRTGPPPHRIGPADLAGEGTPDCFVCGPTGFVEAAAAILIDQGHDAARIRTERFGPSGG